MEGLGNCIDSISRLSNPEKVLTERVTRLKLYPNTLQVSMILMAGQKPKSVQRLVLHYGHSWRKIVKAKRPKSIKDIENQLIEYKDFYTSNKNFLYSLRRKLSADKTIEVTVEDLYVFVELERRMKFLDLMLGKVIHRIRTNEDKDEQRSREMAHKRHPKISALLKKYQQCFDDISGTLPRKKIRAVKMLLNKTDRK